MTVSAISSAWNSNTVSAWSPANSPAAMTAAWMTSVARIEPASPYLTAIATSGRNTT